MRKRRENVLTGRISANPRGFAFVILENSNEADIYISAEDLGGALNNDKVKIRLNSDSSGFRQSGEVIEIIERANSRIIGKYTKNKSSAAVIEPDDSRISAVIIIPDEYPCDAKDGQKVLVEIIKWSDNNSSILKAIVIEVLGTPGDITTEELAIMASYGIDRNFPENVLNEVNRSIKSEVIVTESLLNERRDLRNLRMVTIDGEDARDLDDAVSIEIINDNYYRLGVHIADVSYYVKEGSIVDNEAYKRATSVYFPDRVAPMLPAALSNELCSLNPKVDRLAFSVIMNIGISGELKDYQIFESIINIDKRATYKQVSAILEDEEDLKEEIEADYDEKIISDLHIMKDLSDILRNKRLNRGAVEFDFPECIIKMNGPGAVSDVIKKERNIAERIIEEFMIYCNETVAEHFYRLGAPFLYRIHDKPDSMKIDALGSVARRFGIAFKPTHNIRPQHIQSLLRDIEGNPLEKTINMLVLRSLQKAVYSPQPRGHFGLASDHYCHFTSPIRRYPDLVIHRIMKEWLKSEPSKTMTTSIGKRLTGIAEHCSIREQAADQAEREVDNLLKAEFMRDKIGEEYEAIVSGVMEFGIFVELSNTIEGLVRIENLRGYYEYDERTLSLIENATRDMIRIGDILRVKLMSVNVLTRKLDFEIANTTKNTKVKSKKENTKVKSKKEKTKVNKKVNKKKKTNN